jgi:hypothetical protein
VIWGDDIGISNLSCYSDGLMGYRTPNIDRIADEGARFTDCYGEQSCTAGLAAFITGQNPIRTGLTKVGLPGAEVGIAPVLRSWNPELVGTWSGRDMASSVSSERTSARTIGGEPPWATTVARVRCTRVLAPNC